MTTLTPTRPRLALRPTDTIPTVNIVGAEPVTADTVEYNGRTIATLVKFTKPGAHADSPRATRWAVINPRSLRYPTVGRTRVGVLDRFIHTNTGLLAVEVAELVKEISR